MKRSISGFTVFSFAVLGFAGVVSAQAPAPAPTRPAPAPAARPQPAAPAAPARAAAPAAAEAAPQQMTSSVTATLYRVDEGMFDLRHGKSIDLTDRKVLMTFSQQQGPDMVERKYIGVKFNGVDQYFTPGYRMNFKQFSPTQKLFADKTECYLDYIDLAAPKGAPAVATFRFQCE